MVVPVMIQMKAIPVNAQLAGQDHTAKQVKGFDEVWNPKHLQEFGYRPIHESTVPGKQNETQTGFPNRRGEWVWRQLQRSVVLCTWELWKWKKSVQLEIFSSHFTLVFSSVTIFKLFLHQAGFNTMHPMSHRWQTKVQRITDCWSWWCSHFQHLLGKPVWVSFCLSTRMVLSWKGYLYCKSTPAPPVWDGRWLNLILELLPINT